MNRRMAVPFRQHSGKINSTHIISSGVRRQVTLQCQQARSQFRDHEPTAISERSQTPIPVPPRSPERIAARWRRGRDSNPRYALRAYNGLANRRLQPLGHLSGAMDMPQRPAVGQANQPSPQVVVETGHLLNPLDAEALRCLAALPSFPHGHIGRLDVASVAVGVEQRMCQPVCGKSISISREK